MAKKRKGRRKAQRSGSGGICISTTKPGSGGRGLVFQVTCYKSQAAADKAFMTRKKGSYNAMMYRKRGAKVR